MHMPELRPRLPEGQANAVVEERVDVEVGGVSFQVGDELVARRVRGEGRGEREERQLTELFGQVEVEAVVRLVLPERGDAGRLL